MNKAVSILYGLICDEIDNLETYHPIRNIGDGVVKYGDKNIINRGEPCCCADYLEFVLKIFASGDYGSLIQKFDTFFETHKYVSKRYHDYTKLYYLTVILKKDLKERFRRELTYQFDVYYNSFEEKSDTSDIYHYKRTKSIKKRYNKYTVDEQNIRILDDIFSGVIKKGRVADGNPFVKVLVKSMVNEFHEISPLIKKVFAEYNDDFLFSSNDKLLEHLKLIVD